MIQLILHGIGDYLTQSDWMAQNKRTSAWAALAHATVYGLPFLFIGSINAVFVIWITHLFIDHYGLARYVVWAKEIILGPGLWSFIEPCRYDFDKWNDAKMTYEESREHAQWAESLKTYSWANCSKTGYPSQRPEWLTTWLTIIADNIIHITINYTALALL